MSRDIRQLKKEKATRPKVESGRNAMPSPSQGQSGDIQVKMTPKGPKLLAKIGGQWFKTDLIPSNNTTTVPKVYSVRGITRAATGSTYHFLPSEVNNGNILAINVGISFGSNERTYMHFGGGTQLYEDSGGSTHTGVNKNEGPTAARYNMFIHYNKQYNAVRFEHFSTASSTLGKDFTLAVFYE